MVRARPVDAGQLTDAELVGACRGGQAGAWAELVERFSRYVYAITTRAYRLSDHDAEEVFQEVFARTYEHLDRLRSDDAIRPWIGQLTRRLAIDRLRLSARELLDTESLEQVEERASHGLERIELALGVRAAMAALPGSCQEILDRFFARDQSYQQIAADLDVAMGTVASRISRCLARLRVLLTEMPPDE